MKYPPSNKYTEKCIKKQKQEEQQIRTSSDSFSAEKKLQPKTIRMNHDCCYCDTPIYIEQNTGHDDDGFWHTDCKIDLARADEKAKTQLEDKKIFWLFIPEKKEDKK